MDQTNQTPASTENNMHFLDYWRIIRIRKTVILTVFLLVVVTATILTFFMREQFASTVRIRIEKDVTDVNPVTGERQALSYDPYFIQTEFEVIQSQEVLTGVAEDESLNLPSLFAQRFNQEGRLKTPEVITLLQRMITLSPVRNTSLIEIRVLDRDRNLAAAIANEIAKQYRDYRKSERQQLYESGISVLREQLGDMSTEVTRAEQEVDRLREELKISDFAAQLDSPAPSLDSTVLQQFAVSKIAAQNQLVREKTRLQELRKHSREELRQVLPGATQTPDLILQDLLQRLIMAENELVALRNDYGANHPQVKKVSELAEFLDNEINVRVDGIMKSMSNTVASLEAQVEDLEKQLEEYKEKDRETAERSRPYYVKKRELNRLTRIQEMLSIRVATENIDKNLPRTAIVTILDEAQPGLRPVKPNKALNIILGVVVGLVVGVGLAFFIEYLDTSVKTIDDVERALQAPVLGVVPQNVGYLFAEGAESPHAEAYRVLRTNILFSRNDDKLTSIVVISAGAGEGKSTTILNLATVFAQAGQRAIIIDSDLRRPTLHKIMGVSNSIGLTSYLLKQNTLEEVIQTTNLPTLDFVPSGKLPSSSMGILNSKQMEDLIRDLKQRYDFVFFDSPPMMGLSDAAILASEMDMVLQVVQYRRYPQPMTIRAKQMVEKVGGNLLGIVLNNINMSQDESYYYYSGYYHDYYSKNEDEEPQATELAKNDGKEKEKDKEKVQIKQKY